MDPVNSDDTECMYILLKKSLFTCFETFCDFDCLAFKNQTVAFIKAKKFEICALDFSKFEKYKTYYKLVQPNFRRFRFTLHELLLILY